LLSGCSVVFSRKRDHAQQGGGTATLATSQRLGEPALQQLDIAHDGDLEHRFTGRGGHTCPPPGVAHGVGGTASEPKTRRSWVSRIRTGTKLDSMRENGEGSVTTSR
jgi:hypothetical protein